MIAFLLRYLESQPIDWAFLYVQAASLVTAALLLAGVLALAKREAP
jgi:hypothetical protein